MGKQARQAAQSLARAETAQKNAVLTSLAEQLLAQSALILAANAQDVADSQKAGLAPALLDRLTLNRPACKGWSPSCARQFPCRTGAGNLRASHLAEWSENP